MRLAYSDGEEQEPTSCPAAIHTHEWEGVIVTRLHLRAGRRDDARLLSELALRSKGYWGYDQAFPDACRAELTLTPEDVETRRVTVAERDG